MALDKQQIPISFSKGVDTKTDSKQVLPGKLLTLENASLRKVGKFVKRYGFGVLADTTSLTNGNSIGVFKNELISLDGSNIYSYSEHDDKQYLKGTKLSVDLSTQSIVRNSYEQTNPDSAIHSVGISVYAWEDSSDGVRYSVFDTVTGQSIVSNGLVSATGSKPKVKTIGTYVLIIFLDGLTLKYFKVDTTSPASSFAEVTLVTASSAYFDVQFISSKLVVAYPSSATDVSLFSISTTLVQSADYVVTATASVLSVFGDASNNVWVAYNDTNTVKYFIVDFALSSTVLAVTTIEAGSDPYVNVTGVFNSTAATIFYEVTGDTNNNQYVRKNTATLLGVVGTPSDLLRSVGLYSKAFVYDSSVYVVVTHDSELQSTYFMVNDSGSVVAKIAPSLGGGLSTNGVLSEINFITADVVNFAFEFKDFVTSVNGDVTTQTGVNSAFITFGEQTQLEVIGNNLHLSGGIVSMYDGQNIVEKGFNLYPEVVTATSTYGGGGLSDGQYQYVSTYEWTDAQGQIHRSAPSVPVDVDTENSFTFITAYYFSGTPDRIALRPSITGESFETSMRNFRVGNEITGGPLPSGSYIKNLFYSVYDNLVYIGLNQIYNSGTNAIATFTVKSNYGFSGSSSIGDKDLTLGQCSYSSYFGSGTAGSNFISMSNTSGLNPNMNLFNLTDKFSGGVSIISVEDGVGVTVSSNAIADFTDVNIFVSYAIPFSFSGAASVFTITIPPNGFHYYVGQRIFTVGGAGISYGQYYAYDTGRDIISITKLPTTWIVTISGNINSNGSTYIVGLPQDKEFTEKQVVQVSAGFSSPVEIESVSTNTLTMKQKAAATATLEVYSTQGFSMSVDIETLRITEKENVSIVLYRTEANGTVFYRASSVFLPTINDKTVDSVSIFDGTPDGQLIGNEQLYTTGGEIENISPPASSVTGTFKNRLLLLNDEDKLSFWYSKKVQTNTPAEFTDSFTTRVPERGGEVVAFQQLDDKLIIFKQDLIFAQVGDGPAASGINNDFTDPQIITSDSGCINKKSIALIPTGLIYQSSKGFYLLDRSLNMSYIGADVEAYNESTVTSSKLMEDNNQVRFTLSSGVILVFDYYLSQWDVFTGLNAADSTVYDNKFTYILPSGEVRKENATFTDDEALVPIKLETGWMNLAGLQGFQRIYKLLILGEYKSPHTLTIDLYRDFNTTAFQTVTIPVLTNPGKYQFRVFPNIQKMESFKIKITETQASAPYGEGFEISSIAIEAGVKRGLNKLSKDESFG